MGGRVGTSSIATDSETGRIIGTIAVGLTKTTQDRLFVYSPEGELYFERNVSNLLGALKPYFKTQTDICYEIHGVAINNNLIFLPNKHSRIVYVFTFNAELVSAFGISEKEIISDDKTDHIRSTRLVVDGDGIFVCRNQYVLALIHEIKPQLFEIVKEEEGTTIDILLNGNNLHILSNQKSMLTMCTITILSKNGTLLSTFQCTHTLLWASFTFTLDNKGQYYFCTLNSVLKYNGETLFEIQSLPEERKFAGFEKKIIMDHLGQRLISINATNYPELSINFLTITRSIMFV